MDGTDECDDYCRAGDSQCNDILRFRVYERVTHGSRGECVRSERGAFADGEQEPDDNSGNFRSVEQPVWWRTVYLHNRFCDWSGDLQLDCANWMHDCIEQPQYSDHQCAEYLHNRNIECGMHQ